MKNKYQRLNKEEKKEAVKRYKENKENLALHTRLTRLMIVLIIGALLGIGVMVYLVVTQDKWFYIAEYGFMIIFCVVLFMFCRTTLEKKYNVVISNDAGNYLCNNIYYNGLKYIKDNSLKTKMLFIHIPKINNINNIEDLGDLILLDKKSIRKAVRTYLIRDNKVLVIQYKQKYVGYYNIPGGKIENNESSEQASIREFKEETGIDIIKQHYVGKCMLEFPDRIFDFDVYYVDEYEGKPLDFFDNKSLWVDLEKIQKESKILASIRMIKYIKDNMNLKMFCDDEDNIIKIVDLNKDDKNE